MSGKWHVISRIDSKRGAGESSRAHRLLDPTALSKIYHVLAAKNKSLPTTLLSGVGMAKLPTLLFNESCATDHDAEWDLQAC